MLPYVLQPLSGIRLAFFDYDRTLYTHAYPYPGWKHNTYFEDCAANLDKRKQEELFKNDIPLPCMSWLVDHLKTEGVNCYVLTQEIFNLRNGLKAAKAKQDFGIANYLAVDTAEHKIDMIQAAARQQGIPWKTCLLVDDSLKTVYHASETGIYGLHLSTVAAWYETSVIKPV